MGQQHGQLEFDADFENGSMDRMVRLGTDWYHLMLRPDTWFFFHFRVRGCRGREIIFEFTRRETTSTAECPLGKGARDVWPPSEPYDELKPFVRYPGGEWRRADRMETDRRFPRSYRFAHTFQEDEAYVCYTHPYTHSDMLAWIETVRADARVSLDSLGQSRNGVSQPLLTIAGPEAPKDLVLLISREDSDEPLASWGIEGVVRRLLAPECEELLRRFTFKIVPMVCVDGVIAGATHSAGYGYGGGRWHEEPAPAEIENVKRAIQAWVEQGYRLNLAGKLHGGYGLRSTQDVALASQDTLTARPEIRDALKRDTDAFWVGKPTELQVRPLGFFERYLLDALGFTQSFGTHIQAADPENARRCGEGLMRNMAAWLCQEAPGATS